MAYIFANDQTRGFDVYRYQAKGVPASQHGRWRNAEQTARHMTQVRARLGATSLDKPYCLLRTRGDL